MKHSYYNKDDPLKYSVLTAGPVILTVPVVGVYLFQPLFHRRHQRRRGEGLMTFD